MDKLIGKTIVQIKINEEKDLMAWHCSDGSVMFLSAVGDCCSQSWFEHMAGLEALLNQKICTVIDREMPGREQENDEGDCIQYYGWTFETNRGRCDLEMRNESNGYYGGDCCVSEKALDQYGDVRDDNSTDKIVAEDF